MGYEDVKIRDLSRRTSEWTPPIGALGGPPAHALYTDLVVYAGLQLFRDTRGRPWVVLRDGAQRRAFLVPSPELRSALDRFRMHRNLSPVPEGHISEFIRVVQARISDPDVEIPLLRSPVAEPISLPEWGPTPDATAPEMATPSIAAEEPVRTSLRAVDDLDRHLPRPVERPVPALPLTPPVSSSVREPAPVPPAALRPEPAPVPEAPAPADTATPVPETPVPEPEPPAAPSSGPPIDPSISGARRLPSGENAGLARYVSVLQTLVRDGTWLGTTEELSNLMQDEPLTMFNFLHKYRPELARRDILITSVEVEDGFRWLAVDRAKTQRAAQGRVPDYRATHSR